MAKNMAGDDDVVLAIGALGKIGMPSGDWELMCTQSECGVQVYMNHEKTMVDYVDWKKVCDKKQCGKNVYVTTGMSDK